MDLEHVSVTLTGMRDELSKRRDNEVSMAADVAGQYVTDHNDKEAYRAIDREVNRLAKAWDRMITLLDKTIAKAEAIEGSCENFYGD